MYYDSTSAQIICVTVIDKSKHYQGNRVGIVTYIYRASSDNYFPFTFESFNTEIIDITFLQKK